jgi:CTP synthase (UTP-ammonia lyase)
MSLVMPAIKIAIIGDFNFAYNAHHATNMSLDHSSNFFEEEINYYWIRPSEVLAFKKNELQDYDGIWLASGPYLNEFYFSGAVREVMNAKRPTLVTGEGFYHVVDYYVKQYNLNPKNEKVISDNLVSGNHFESVLMKPVGNLGTKIYSAHNPQELTSTRFSVYPNLVEILEQGYIHIEARDQFDEVQLFRLMDHQSFLVSMFLPQISSTRDLPHPIVNAFVRSCMKTAAV